MQHGSRGEPGRDNADDIADSTVLDNPGQYLGQLGKPVQEEPERGLEGRALHDVDQQLGQRAGQANQRPCYAWLRERREHDGQVGQNHLAELRGQHRERLQVLVVGC